MHMSTDTHGDSFVTILKTGNYSKHESVSSATANNDAQAQAWIIIDTNLTDCVNS